MSNLVGQDVHGGEASGGVGAAHHICGTKLGDHASVRRQAHPAHGCQAHSDTVAAAPLL